MLNSRVIKFERKNNSLSFFIKQYNLQVGFWKTAHFEFYQSEPMVLDIFKIHFNLDQFEFSLGETLNPFKTSGGRAV